MAGVEDDPEVPEVAHHRREGSYAYRLARDEWLPALVGYGRFDLGGDVSAASRAREILATSFADVLGAYEVDTLRLVVSELVTNAVLHGQADDEHHVILYLAVAPQRIRAEVCDSGPGLDPDALPSRDGRPGGFGLVIVNEITSRWGVSTDEGTCVWFELDRDDDAPPWPSDAA